MTVLGMHPLGFQPTRLCFAIIPFLPVLLNFAIVGDVIVAGKDSGS